MAIQFFITPYRPPHWKTATSDLQIDIGEFETALRKQWNEVEIETTSTGGLLWRIVENGNVGFFGGLQSNKQIISFSPGNWTTFKDFVLWYRNFIPARYQLYFFNSSSWNSLEITENTTKQEIEDLISRPPEIEEQEL